MRPAWTPLVTAAQTGTTFELIREDRSELGGPAPHVHRDHEELFVILEGLYRFVRGSDELEVAPGGVVHIPRGIRHGYRTLIAPSRTFILVAPPGLEEFFRAMGARIDAGESALEAMTALAADHDVHPEP